MTHTRAKRLFYLQFDIFHHQLAILKSRLRFICIYSTQSLSLTPDYSLGGLSINKKMLRIISIIFQSEIALDAWNLIRMSNKILINLNVFFHFVFQVFGRQTENKSKSQDEMKWFSFTIVHIFMWCATVAYECRGSQGRYFVCGFWIDKHFICGKVHIGCSSQFISLLKTVDKVVCYAIFTTKQHRRCKRINWMTRRHFPVCISKLDEDENVVTAHTLHNQLKCAVNLKSIDVYGLAETRERWISRGRSHICLFSR